MTSAALINLQRVSTLYNSDICKALINQIKILIFNMMIIKKLFFKNRKLIKYKSQRYLIKACGKHAITPMARHAADLTDGTSSSRAALI